MAESKSAALPLGYAPSRRNRPLGARTIAARRGPINWRRCGHARRFFCWFSLHDGRTNRGPDPPEARMTYRAPVADIVFSLEHAAGFEAALAEGLYGDLGEELIHAVLAEAGRFATEVLSPLNRTGDRGGAQFNDGVVTTPPGWKEAYRAWTKAGWN